VPLSISSKHIIAEKDRVLCSQSLSQELWRWPWEPVNRKPYSFDQTVVPNVRRLFDAHFLSLPIMTRAPCPQLKYAFSYFARQKLIFDTQIYHMSPVSSLINQEEGLLGAVRESINSLIFVIWRVGSGMSMYLYLRRLFCKFHSSHKI
jgi:hypothetical protein